MDERTDGWTVGWVDRGKWMGERIDEMTGKWVGGRVAGKTFAVLVLAVI